MADVRPLCTINPSNAEFVLADSDAIEVECMVAFHSAWTPHVKCSLGSSDGSALASESSTNSLVHKATFVVLASADGKQVECTTTFRDPTSSAEKPNVVTVGRWMSPKLHIRAAGEWPILIRAIRGDAFSTGGALLLTRSYAFY